MNEDLKRMLITLKIDGNLRVRLDKIFDQQSPVTRIDLRGYEYGKKLVVDKEDLCVLLQVSKQIPTLQELVLLGDALDNESAILISKALSEMPTLTALYVEGAKIGDDGAVAVFSALERLPNIATIYVHGDRITDRGVMGIVQSIARNRSIHALSIQGCLIGEAGLNSIASLLALNRLRQISVKCTTVEDTTCKLLGQRIAEDSLLQGFALEADDIVSVEALMDGFRINSSLTEIVLNADNFSSAVTSEVEIITKDICVRNAQGFVQVLVEKAMVELRERFGLKTHALDQVWRTRVIDMMRTLPVATQGVVDADADRMERSHSL